jgi:hypothetical protein
MLSGMPSAAVSPLRTFRILAVALMGALVVIGIALSFTVSSHRTDRNGNPVHTHTPSVWMYVVIVALGLIAAGLAQTFGYRIPALPSNLDPAESRATALRVYQQSMFLRFALSESVAIIAIALLFAGRSNTILPYVVAAVIAELLMAYHVWPSESLISRVEQRLDRNGGRSDLANALNGTA